MPPQASNSRWPTCLPNAAPNLKISTIARGVPIGGDLEYADEVTLGRSILSRIAYE